MEDTKIVRAFIEGLDQSIETLEPVLDKLLSKSLVDRLAETESSLEKAKITNGYTYILSSLIFAYLKSKGDDTTNHEIMRELNKCKSYMKRAKDLESGVTKPENKAYAAPQLSGNSTVVTGVQEPAISRVSFEGKHTKFDEDSDTEVTRGGGKAAPSVGTVTSKPSKVTKADSQKKTKAKKQKQKKPKV